MLTRLSLATSGVTLVCAPAGSGKTVLLRSWVETTGVGPSTAWVSVDRAEHHPQQFWISVITALAQTAPGSIGISIPTPTPDFDGDTAVRRLALELDALEQRVVLVIDDLHELTSTTALAQLEVLLAARPAGLDVVLASRHDPQLGLHRFRVAGELSELRAVDLRFGEGEARELLTSADVVLSEAAFQLLYQRTEGWAAGLRLAALSLTTHPEPERFVAEFSGSERTIGEYLVAEVLDHQSEEVRHLLLRTSLLDRVSGPLADAVTGRSGSERILHALEAANAFVLAEDAGRSWFRYHRLFADLLRLELRRTAPLEVESLHRAAAGWYVTHGFVLDAIRHAQAAHDWARAISLLADHSFSLALNGQEAATQALLAAFPSDVAVANPELEVVIASVQLARGSLDEAAGHLALAEQHSSAVPADRRRRFEVASGVSRLSLARRRGDFSSVLDEVEALARESPVRTSGDIGLAQDVRALALLNLGIAELWSQRFDEAERHLEEGSELARAIGRPYIEVGCLGHWAIAANLRSLAVGRQLSERAIALADEHGWSADPVVVVALVALGRTMLWLGRFDEADALFDRAERSLAEATEPATALLLHSSRGTALAVRGRLTDALAEFELAERMQVLLAAPHALLVQLRTSRCLTRVWLGEFEQAREDLLAMGEGERRWGETQVVCAALLRADGDPRGAIDVVLAAIGGPAPVLHGCSAVDALLIEAACHDDLGDSRSAEAAIERALGLAEPKGMILSFALVPVRDLLERHPRHRTAHPALLSEILAALAGSPRRDEATEVTEVLSEGELVVLRFLPSNLSASEIGAELFLSVHTVKTHMRHIYSKLGVHKRSDAVLLASRLGLLAFSSRRH